MATFSSFVLPQGNSGDIVIPANESIAVACQGSAQVSRKIGFPNYPDQVTLLGTVTNGQTVFGPYSTGATIIVEASGGVTAFYEVGTAPVVQQGRLNTQVQVTPANITDGASMAFAAADLLTGYVTATPTTSRNVQLPTGANMDLATNMAVNDSFDWTLATLAAFALTITQGASGHTIVGAAATAATSGSAARFRTRKTAADTFVTYRLA
jgi:hypothetical protein